MGLGAGDHHRTRKTPQSPPSSDKFTVWSRLAGQARCAATLHGASERILNWTTFGGPYQQAPELALVYDDCYGCDAPSTFFTTLYYNFTAHAWRARWMRGDQAAVALERGSVEGVKRTQVYGLLTEPPGRDVLATWSHNDYGNAKPAEDFVFEYSVDPIHADGADPGPERRSTPKRWSGAFAGRRGAQGSVQVDPALAQLARGQDSDALPVI
jgi:hypothetical protein